MSWLRSLLVGLCVVMAGQVMAACDGKVLLCTGQAAYDACMAKRATVKPNSNPSSCYLIGYTQSGGYRNGAYRLDAGGETWTWSFSEALSGGSASNPCVQQNLADMSGGYAGKVLESMRWCKSGVPDRSTNGATVSCSMAFVPSGMPTMNQWGSWHTPGRLVVSGDLCDGTGGTNSWKNPDGTAPKADAAPPSPSTTPPENPIPKLCGGGSCYDAASDQFCAVSGGQQFCVPGNNARTSSGGCSSSGDGTVCAGSPTAKTPPPDKVPDPPTAIRNSDSYTQANSKTGALQEVRVNVYTPIGGQAPSSGQSSGDRGPAPASSSPTPGNSASGGNDCGSPPVMSGDAALAMIARQQWLTRCGPDKSDKNGNGQPDWTEVSDADGDKYNVSQTSRGDVFKDGESGFEKVDSTSWAGNSCPALPTPQVFGQPFLTDQDFFCRYLALVRVLVILGASIVCGLMLSGGKS